MLKHSVPIMQSHDFKLYAKIKNSIFNTYLTLNTSTCSYVQIYLLRLKDSEKLLDCIS